MIAQLLEAKMLAAISAAIPSTAPAHKCFGAWQPATAGLVKNQEDGNEVAVIAIALGTMQRETFTSPTSSYSGTVALNVRLDRDVTGSALLTFADSIEGKFAAWQGLTYQQAFTELNVTGFNVGDIKCNGGQPVVIDFSTKTAAATWSFTISGCDA